MKPLFSMFTLSPILFSLSPSLSLRQYETETLLDSDEKKNEKKTSFSFGCMTFERKKQRIIFLLFPECS